MKKRVLVTCAPVERLKILSFLLRVASWEVTIVPPFAQALEQARPGDPHEQYDLLLVADYYCLGCQQVERQQQLKLLSGLFDHSWAPAVIISAPDWSKVEQNTLCEQLLGIASLYLCNANQLLPLINQYPQLNSKHKCNSSFLTTRGER